MRFIQPITEEEMVAHFLLTELHSERFREAVERILEREQINRKIVEQPNIHDGAENAQRALLLGEWRGYRRNQDVFTDMPEDVRWWRARASRADLMRVKYINDDYWTEFSGGSRLVIQAARRITSGQMPEVAAGYLSLADDLDRGAEFPELIFLYNAKEDELVVLEGHIRVTAHAIRQLISKQAPSELTVLVGCSDLIRK